MRANKIITLEKKLFLRSRRKVLATCMWLKMAFLFHRKPITDELWVPHFGGEISRINTGSVHVVLSAPKVYVIIFHSCLPACSWPSGATDIKPTKWVQSIGNLLERCFRSTLFCALS